MHQVTHIPDISDPPPGSLRGRDNRFYELLAGGARTRLLEAFLELGIPELLGGEGPLTAGEICRRLKLDPHRGWKFLHLLALAGLLDEDGAEHGGNFAIFALSTAAKEYFGEDGRGGYFFRDLVNYWRNVAILPLVDVLGGMPLPEAVRWPPPGEDAAIHLETWMRVTADGAIKALIQSAAMLGACRLLDVGGGDGTIGCALAHQYPQLEVTVYNLPASAAIARRTIAERRFSRRVSVNEGNFLTDELPGRFDRVLFNRVLTDWSSEVCRMLFEKARRALSPGGRLVINEALVDGNLNYTIAWEFRYIFYDTFGRAMFKPLEVYRQLLAETGFEISKVSPMLDDAFYSVIEAKPV